MSQTVEIRRFTTRYRLRPSQFDAKYRLDRLLPEVAGEALELALERAGVPENEIVCIRSLSVPVRLRLSLADSALVAEWARLLAEAIADAAREPDSDAAVRYGSRTLALARMGAHIAQGRFHQVWAWRQLGFWRDNTEPSNRQVGALEFAAALCREPETAVPVLTALAARGLLHPLARYLEDAWPGIAIAVLAAAGVRAADTDWRMEAQAAAVEETTAPTRAAAPTSLSRPALRRAERVLQHSALLRECGDASQPEPAGMALLVLALLEVEPSLVRAGAGQLFEAARALHDAAIQKQSQRPASVKPVPQTPALGEAPRRIERLPQTPESARPIPDAVPERIASQAALNQAEPASAEVEIEGLLRAEGFTEFGGLLYLIGILDALQIPQRALASTALVDRGLDWVLHRLAMSLQPVPPDDPAALAFAGLGPAAPHPSWRQPPPAPEEQDSVESFAAEIRHALAEALPHPGRTPEMLMQFVCRRPARIVADPGWIEIRLPLGGVSTEIRRAGLDIDPNYVPWLGVVVRFVYE